MKVSMKKVLAAIVTVVFIFSVISGCGRSDTSTGGSTSTASGSQAEKKLTAWAPVYDYTGMAMTNAEMPFYIELEKQTGVTIEWTHPPIGQESEGFNLLLASGVYPDLIQNGWPGYPGGPDKAISDGVIIAMNDLLPTHGKNFKNILDNEPFIDKLCKSAAGNYYTVPYMMIDPAILTWAGPVIRKDLLEKTGLPAPTTIDEWEIILKAFKNDFGMDSAFSSVGWIFDYITPSFNTGGGFYQVGGKIKFGPIEPGYKDFLATMASWYAEGLLDNDWASQDGTAFDAKILNGRIGITITMVGGGIGRFTPQGREMNPDFTLMGIPYPVLNKGDTPKRGQQDLPATIGASSFAISTACKSPETAMEWLDYCYDYNQSSPGHMLFNYGIEGVSYEMIDGFPTFTELLTNNPDGYSLKDMLQVYTLAGGSGPGICDIREFVQFFQFPEQTDAVKTWVTDTTEAIPPVAPSDEADFDRLAIIMTDVNTYIDEMKLKFIMGQEPIENYDKFVDNLKGMGVEEAIELTQKAFEEFLNR